MSLKIVSLNCWGGRFMYNLARFIRSFEGEVDVFMLQEVFDASQGALDEHYPSEFLNGAMLKELRTLMPDHYVVWPQLSDPDGMNICTFVRRSLRTLSAEDVDIVPSGDGFGRTGSRKAQSVSIETLDGHTYQLVNYHGMYTGDKNDSSERFTQSINLNGFIARRRLGKLVLAGDFNLNLDTESLAMLDKDRVNLVKQYRVDSTRTPLYRSWGNPCASQHADYVIVSPDVRVRHFRVLPDLVSDHAALYVEID